MTPGPAIALATRPATTYMPVPTQLPTPRDTRSAAVRTSASWAGSSEPGATEPAGLVLSRRQGKLEQASAADTSQGAILEPLVPLESSARPAWAAHWGGQEEEGRGSGRGADLPLLLEEKCLLKRAQVHRGVSRSGWQVDPGGAQDGGMATAVERDRASETFMKEQRSTFTTETPDRCSGPGVEITLEPPPGPQSNQPLAAR